jgi:plastocyanin
VTTLLAALILAVSSHVTPVGLGMREYRFSLYRPTVHAGRVAFNMTNFGEDPHNLRISGPHGYRSAVSGEVAPFGGRLRFNVNLRRAGTYRLICVMPGHAAKGMKTTLHVARRHPR